MKSKGENLPLERMEKLVKKQRIQEGEYDFPYHYLDLKVDIYRLIRRIEYLSLLDRVKNLLQPFQEQRVLDVGCGDGRFCYELKNEKVKVVGVDFSESAIRFAKAFNPEVEFFVQDIRKLNLPCNFDYALLIETLEHIPPEEVPKVLEKLSDILKRKGKLIVTVPSKNLSLSEKHYQHFTKESLESTLQGYFRITKIEGHSKIGIKRNIFTNLKRMGIFLFPFRNKLLMDSFYRFLKGYYKKHLETCNPEEGRRLIAVCEKK